MFFRTRVQLPAPPPLDSRAERAKSSGVPSERRIHASRGAPRSGSGSTSLKSLRSLVAGPTRPQGGQRSRESRGTTITASPPPHFVYILRCADNTFYVGHTSNLDARVEAHNEGRGCGYTAARRPVQLVFSESCDSLALAVEREAQIKRWSGKKKAALAGQNARELRSLSRRRKYGKKA